MVWLWRAPRAGDGGRPTVDSVGVRRTRGNDRVQTSSNDYENRLTADGAGHTGGVIDIKYSKLVRHLNTLLHVTCC